jgi:RNase adapter protein RapZ
MRLIIISGYSGSGKSTALHVLEDVGFTCIDNLPAGLLPDFTRHVESLESDSDSKYAIGIDARNSWQDLERLPKILQSTKTAVAKLEIIFLGARNTILIQRFSETRRKHPLSDTTIDLREAIKLERTLLQPIANMADLIIDTSNLNLHELRDLVIKRVATNNAEGMAILFESFGFKRGVPVDAELVFDVRCLPNPYWKLELRGLTGFDTAVQEFLNSHSEVPEMLEDIYTYLAKWIPRFEASNRSYLTIAIGCTGGQHRSVYLCEQLLQRFKSQVKNVQVRHRELGKRQTPIANDDKKAEPEKIP